MTELRMIPVNMIDASSHNPRHIFDDGSLHALANSISRLGVLQPVLLVETLESGRYEIVAGERRWRASCIAKKAEIPALIIELDDPLLREVQIVENLEREQLDPIDEALAFKSLQEQFGYTDTTLAQRLKRSTQFIRNRLELLKLPSSIQKYVTEDKIAIGTALELARIEETEAQLRFAKEILEGRLTAADTASRVNRYKLEKRIRANQDSKKLNLKRKAQTLASQGTVITSDSYDPVRHHRIWDLLFVECASCTRKGTFLRSDGQVEDVCIVPDCYNSLLANHENENSRMRRMKHEERAQALEKVLESDTVEKIHLLYLLWTMLNFMGPTINAWRLEVNLPPYSDAPAAVSTEWDHISNWPYERILTNVMHLSISHIASLGNSYLPTGLKQSLIVEFGIKPYLLDESSI